MSPIFFYRKNPRHICKMDTRLIFQHISQKIKINRLCFFVFFILPKNAVPFINNDNKRSSCLFIYILHCLDQIIFIKIIHIRVLSFHIAKHQFFHPLQQLVYIPASAQKFLHIKRNRIIMIQIFFKIFVFCNFESRKKCFGITPTAIICCKHICRCRFSKSSRTANAKISLHCIQYLIRIAQHTRFVHINFRINNLTKSICIGI